MKTDRCAVCDAELSPARGIVTVGGSRCCAKHFPEVRPTAEYVARIRRSH